MLSPADTAYLAGLRSQTMSILEGVIGRDREVVYLDTPRHRNLGDTLIWAGGLGYLKDLGNRIVYHTDMGRFRDSDASRFPSRAAILLHGGGNLGDLYPAQEAFRQHIVLTLRNREIVVLPQSVHFSSRDAELAAYRGYKSGRQLTVLLRERSSLGLLRENMPHLSTAYCPDLALRAEIPAIGSDPGGDVVVLARKDSEATVLDRDASAPDWQFGAFNTLRWHAGLAVGRIQKRLPGRARDLALHATQRANSQLLSINLSAARNQFRGARAVATNRLHAHILACMMGIPNYVSDNSYGKISRIFTEYSGGFETAHMAPSLEAAIAAASSTTNPEEGGQWL